MDSPLTADSLRQLLGSLYSQPGITGACLQLSGTVLVHDLPYSDDRVAQWAAQVNQLVESYTLVDRGIWQICAGFENFRVLIVCHAELRLSLLLQPDLDPTMAAGRGMHLLMEVKSLVPQARPSRAEEPDVVPPAEDSHDRISREEFEKLVCGLLSRVTGSAQASKLIQREMAAQKINGSTSIDPGQARRIGLSILEFIPNRGKRATLSSEFLNALDQ
jgi:hypothetical protein